MARSILAAKLLFSVRSTSEAAIHHARLLPAPAINRTSPAVYSTQGGSESERTVALRHASASPSGASHLRSQRFACKRVYSTLNR
jgi:predicted amidohydrolase